MNERAETERPGCVVCGQPIICTEAHCPTHRPTPAVCDICHGQRVWISKEGAEIPCDFCVAPRPAGETGGA